MKKRIICKNTRIASLVLIAAFAGIMEAQADLYDFSFSGGGISASGTFTTVPTGTAGVDQINSITGTFDDTNVSISGSITGLEVTTVPGPPPFTPAISSQGFSFDNLFYPAGNSPAVCADYPFFGGTLDCYGLVFDVVGGYSAEVWSNGVLPGASAPQYNAADANATGFLDYPDPVDGVGITVGFTAQAVPEFNSVLFLGTGLLGLAAFRKRKRTA